MSGTYEDARDIKDRTLTIFQFLKEKALQTKIKIASKEQEYEEVVLLRRGRQNVRVQHSDGSITLVPLQEVLLEDY